MQTTSTPPTISVITVCFNAGYLLQHTVSSVCGQTYPHIEYIVIDGGSSDGSLDTIAEYRPMIAKLVSEPDKGIYDAMNKGLQLATGDYVCFMNAGDTFATNDTLQRALGSITPPLPGVIYGETDIVDSHFRFVRYRRLRAPEHLTSKSFKLGMLVCHQSFYALRTLAPQYDTTYKYSADIDWCIKILKQSPRNHNTHEILTHYLEEGTTTQHHRASLKERFRVMTRHYGFIQTALLHLYFAVRSIFLK